MDILFNKYMIQNPVFCVKLSIIYAIVLWANFYVKFLMSSTKAAVNSFDECSVFEKAAMLSVIVYDNKLYNSNDEAFSINTVCNCRSRDDNFVYFNRPRTHGIRVCDRKPSRIPKKYTYFEEIQESKTLTLNLHQKKHTEVFPDASFYK